MILNKIKNNRIKIKHYNNVKNNEEKNDKNNQTA